MERALSVQSRTGAGPSAPPRSLRRSLELNEAAVAAAPVLPAAPNLGALRIRVARWGDPLLQPHELEAALVVLADLNLLLDRTRFSKPGQTPFGRGVDGNSLIMGASRRPPSSALFRSSNRGPMGGDWSWPPCPRPHGSGIPGRATRPRPGASSAPLGIHRGRRTTRLRRAVAGAMPATNFGALRVRVARRDPFLQLHELEAALLEVLPQHGRLFDRTGFTQHGHTSFGKGNKNHGGGVARPRGRVLRGPVQTAVVGCAQFLRDIILFGGSGGGGQGRPLRARP